MNIIPVIQTISPIVLLIALGVLMRQKWLTQENFWKGLNDLVYWVLFPALMITAIGNTDVKTISEPHFILVLLAISLSLITTLFLTKPLFFKNNDFFVSFMQGAVRYNSYVFIGVVVYYLGEGVMPIVAMITAVIVASTNVICTAFLVFYSRQKRSVLSGFFAILKNPLVLSCTLGLVISFFQIPLTTIGNHFLQFLASAALPLGLLCVGADLRFAKDKRTLSGVLLCCVIKLVVVPALVWMVLSYGGFDKGLILVCLIYAASPCSANAFSLTKSFKGDSQSMALIISTQTVLSLPLLTLWIVAYQIFS